MTEDISIISVEDRERWEDEHREGGLPSQSWIYARGLMASGIMAKLAVVRCKGSRMLLPFFERSWNGTTDIATIPGLSGASIDPSSAAPLSLWREFAISQRWVAGYIQLAMAVRLDEIPPGSQLVAHNSCFILDLRRWDSTRVCSSNIWKKIRLAVRKGVQIIDDKRALSESLKHLYPRAMQRRGATTIFSSEALDQWARDPACLIIGAALNNAVVAVHLIFVAGVNAEWHVGVTTEIDRDLSAFVLWNAMERLRDRGVETFNMGGGVRIGDGIYQFKERFGGTPAPLQSIRQIYDNAKYEELCELTNASRESTWFPPYRAATKGSAPSFERA
jgi:CelD/BcsL family acetyltransferase involved in cellulose biosynthesis